MTLISKHISCPRYLITALLVATAFILANCDQPDNKITVKAVKGQPAPDFELTDLKGNDWKLSELRGKVVFINFWATWCPPCLQEMPSMQKLHDTLQGESFQMLAILYNDRPEMGQSMVIKSGYTFPVLIDADSRSAKEYGLTGVPETFIIDADGILREKFIGPYEWTSPDKVALIRKYLPK